MFLTSFFMKITINHLARMEGHASFIGALENGDLSQAKIITEEGIRLVEGCLKQKSMFDAHVITMRICGICPIVHNLAAIKAMENAMKVKVSLQTVKLRQLMELSQLIHSHAMHLYFLSLPDFLGNAVTERLMKKFPQEAQLALRLRAFGNRVNELIGGRSIHPLNNWIGGFKVTPPQSALTEIQTQINEALADAVKLAKFFAKLKYPKFERPTAFASLDSRQNYAIYDGQISISAGAGRPFSRRYSSREFYDKIQEVEEAGSLAKRAVWSNQHFMVGALARVNNHGHKLNAAAKKIWRAVHGSATVCNPFYNILAQAVEIVHCVEEMEKITGKLKIKKEAPVKFKIRAGEGIATVEAPRGILLHYYQIDAKARIVRADIITPTVMFLGNLEDDLGVYLPQTKKMTTSQRVNKIRMLIRAYDPCISCATH